MRKLIYVLILFVTVNLLAGCGNSIIPTKITKSEYSPNFYSKHPKSILILPAVNTTTAADAADHFRYTITQPLSEQGYYVFPVHLVDSFFKSENLPDAELIRNISIKKLRKIFNADAILYVDILNWDTNYNLIESSVDVGLSFLLVDANSEEEIWHGNTFSKVATVANTGGLAQLAISLLEAAVNTSVDYTKLASDANLAAAINFPFGPFSESYKQDHDDILKLGEVLAAHMRPSIEEGRVIVNRWFIEDISSKTHIGPMSIGSYRNTLPYSGAFHIINSYGYWHSHFDDYYYSYTVQGVTYLRHRFFLYENNRPFLVVDNKKVFIKASSEGRIKYTKSYTELDFWTTPILELSLDGDPYEFYFDIDSVVNLKSS